MKMDIFHIVIYCSFCFIFIVQLQGSLTDVVGEEDVDKLLRSLEDAYKREVDDKDNIGDIVDRCIRRFVDKNCVRKCIGAYHKRSTGFKENPFECSGPDTRDDMLESRSWTSTFTRNRWWRGVSTRMARRPKWRQIRRIFR